MSDKVPATREDRTATVKELAAALQLPAGTVRRYVAEGAVKPVGKRGRWPVYDGQDVAAERYRRRVAQGLVR